MNGVSVSDTHNDLEISVHRGLAKTGEEHVQISIYKKIQGFQQYPQYPESICCDVGTWNALITIVQSLRDAAATHSLTRDK